VTCARATLVLVHGAWHGRWCWERLTPHLERRGFAVRTLDLPSVHTETSASADPAEAPGLVADAAAVRSLLDEVGAPVVLCGHSYAGMVISLAAAGARNVARLVYLAAFMPERRQSLVLAGGGRHAPWIRMLDGGLMLPDLSLAGEVFYGDCDPAARESAIARLRPQHSVAFAQPVPDPAWRDIPSTFVVCSEDRAIPPGLQRTVFAPRAARVLELESSHSPFLSRPEALAGLLAEETVRA
jgi:pimeloyl-ACP methyl ester carboxylesterase